jgi:hypothetical protein
MQHHHSHIHYQLLHLTHGHGSPATRSDERNHHKPLHPDHCLLSDPVCSAATESGKKEVQVPEQKEARIQKEFGL